MARWEEVAAAEPEFADRVRRMLDAHRHKTLATLRRDGSPRISGIEAPFVGGEVWLGMMPGSVKALDLGRDPRLALHSASEDPPEDDPGGWPGGPWRSPTQRRWRRSSARSTSRRSRPGCSGSTSARWCSPGSETLPTTWS